MALRNGGNHETECIVLLSGGLDSAACTHFLLQEFSVRAVHLAYGQPAEIQEREAAVAIAKHYGIPLSLIRLGGCRPKARGEVLGRNAFLLFAALSEISSTQGAIAIGIHSGSPYYDCSQRFVESIQSLVDGYCDGRIRVLAPFANWTKGNIWDYCLMNDVPINLTYSCEEGLGQPCGECLSCRDLEALSVRQKLHHST